MEAADQETLRNVLSEISDDDDEDINIDEELSKRINARPVSFPGNNNNNNDNNNSDLGLVVNDTAENDYEDLPTELIDSAQAAPAPDSSKSADANTGAANFSFAQPLPATESILKPKTIRGGKAAKTPATV